MKLIIIELNLILRKSYTCSNNYKFIFRRSIPDLFQNVEENYVEWMDNTLKSEKFEWYASHQPRFDVYSGTSAPIIIFQMIDQNLQVAKTISDEMTFKVLSVSIDQVIKFGHSYRASVMEFRKMYFEDRNKVILHISISNSRFYHAISFRFRILLNIS